VKKIAEKYLDRNIIYRNKVGFEVPVSHWFRNEMKEYLRDNLTRKSAFSLDYFKRESIEKLIDDHVSGKKDNYKKLWILLNFELWRDRFIS
jgi:asparagine synthase (glutamine-hydrolysing)